MKFTFAHNNFNVMNLEKSLKFYEEALGLKEVRRKEAADGSFILVYLGDGVTPHQLELTWLRDWERTATTWETMNFIWLLRWMIWRRPIKSMRRWAASALRILPWGSILSQIRTTTGWKLCRGR